MNKNQISIVFKPIFVIMALFFFSYTNAQQNYTINQSPNFWDKVQFGGGLGLGFGTGYTNISVMPSAIYNINPIVSVGAGLQFGYIYQKNYSESFVWGGSAIVLVNPIPEVQLSAELEQIRVDEEFKQYNNYPSYSEAYWNTALYLGAGYRTGNVTIGGRYDVLYNPNKSLYGSGFMPFVRVYF